MEQRCQGVSGRPVAGVPAMHPSVSIIIVTYNSAATLGPCLSSVLATLRQGDDVVVVDNNSRDATLEIAASLNFTLTPGIMSIIANPTNRGFSIATNQGIRATGSPLIVLLNPDTIVTSGWLDRMSAHFISSSVGAVGPVSNFAAGRQSVLPYWQGNVPDAINPEDAAGLLYGWNHGVYESAKLLTGFCMMVRRDITEKFGGLDERLFLGNDDLELSWRLRLHGLELHIACDVFIFHEGQHSFRSEPESLTGQLVRESSDALYRILEDHYGPSRVPTPEELWGIDWFNPPCGTFNPRVPFGHVFTRPHACPLPTPERHPLVSIVILTFNQLDYTMECLAALELHTPEPHEVILVDNGSRDDTVQWFESQAAAKPNYRLINNGENRGFAAGCNQGMAVARGDYLLLLNNDVVVTPEWLTGLLECHRADPLTGIVGPLTNNASGIQGLGNIESGGIERLDSFARTFRVRHRFQRVASRRLVGFCMLFFRTLYQEIGGLDERFGTGNFEDDDFCLRAAIAGYRNLIAGDVYVHHHGSVSFKGANVDYRTVLTGNWSLFREKWSRPVADKTFAAEIAACRAREDAERLLLEERLDEALALLEKACREYGSDRLLRQLLCFALREAGRSDDALTLIPAETPTALTIRARSLLAVGRHEEVESLLLSAINADPGHGEAYLLRGYLERRRGEEAFAAALILKGFLLSPTVSEFGRATDWMVDSPWFSQLVTVAEEAVQLYPHSRMLARLRVELASHTGDNQAILAAAEYFIKLFGPDERILDLGVAARRAMGSWHSPAPVVRSVSLCMIVKDEERHIVHCLTSCRPLVCEMVVVDTGSCDRTAALAELMGARVIRYPWQDDFADARNVSIDSATGDWILVMDGDEVLSPRDYPAFRKVLDVGACPGAFTMLTRNYTNSTALDGFAPLDGSYPEEEAGVGWTPSVKVRLFSNHHGIRFEGMVHEMVEESITRTGLPLREHPVPVHHYGGLESARLERKRLHYYVLGQRKLGAGKQDPKALYELAVQAGELERFAEAEGYWLALLEQEPEFPVAWFNLGYLYLRMGRPKDAMAATEHAVALKPGYQAALVNLALCRFCLLPPPDALVALEEIAAIHVDDRSIQMLRHVALCLTGRLDEGITGLRSLAACGYSMTDFLKATAGLLRSAGRLEEGQVLEALVGVLV